MLRPPALHLALSTTPDRSSFRRNPRPHRWACRRHSTIPRERGDIGNASWPYARVSTVEQDAEAQLRALQRHGCHLIFLSEAIDTSTRAAGLVLVLFAALNELEADLARERTRLAARLGLERGSCGAPIAVSQRRARPARARHVVRQAGDPGRDRQEPRHRRLDALHVVLRKEPRCLSRVPHRRPSLNLAGSRNRLPVASIRHARYHRAAPCRWGPTNAPPARRRPRGLA